MNELIEKLKNNIYEGKITLDCFNQFLMENQVLSTDEGRILQYIEENNITIVETETQFNNGKLNANQYPKLTRQEERDLFIQARNGNKTAKEEIINANSRSVEMIASYDKYKNYHLSYEDLRQEGYLGLIKAYEKFDYTRDVSFSTYAFYWINKYIIDAISRSRLIFIPQDKYSKIKRMNEVKDEYFNEHGVEPTKEQLAHILRIDEDKITELESYIYYIDSFDKPIENEDGDKLSLANIVKEDDPFAPEQVEYLLNTLDKRDSEIVKLHFGIGMDEPLKNNQIGERYGLTKQAVGQIIDRSLRKMKEEYDKL